MKTRLILKEGANPNYLATICQIKEIYPIEGADRVVKTVINGYDMIISKDIKIGDVVVYVPVETVICHEFLSRNNFYDVSCYELNENKEEVEKLLEQRKSLESKLSNEYKEVDKEIKSKCGFFNRHGRVRILKLRGQYSMGFLIPWEQLLHSMGLDMTLQPEIGYQFNYIGDIEFCKKYIVAHKENEHVGAGKGGKATRRAYKRFDRLIEDTFQFHYDTKQLGEHFYTIDPSDYVSISVKCHGTSGIFANIPTRRELKWYEKVKKFFGLKVSDIVYDNIYSSRKVIKNKYINEKADTGYYSNDTWGVVNELLKPYIDHDMTVYGEIVGYEPGTSKCIQKNPDHDYGCRPGEWKFMPYRIVTGADRKEWNVNAVYNWTVGLIWEHPELKNNLMPIEILYMGQMKDLYPDIPVDDNWHMNVLERMKNDTENFGMELDEPLCFKKVPREGIVIRIDNDKFPRAWKLKCKRHYTMEAKQHDNGDVDIEEEN